MDSKTSADFPAKNRLTTSGEVQCSVNVWLC